MHVLLKMGILFFVNIRVSKGISLVAPNRWACILPILEEGFTFPSTWGALAHGEFPFSTFCLGKATHTGSASNCSRSIFSGHCERTSPSHRLGEVIMWFFKSEAKLGFLWQVPQFLGWVGETNSNDRRLYGRYIYIYIMISMIYL